MSARDRAQEPLDKWLSRVLLALIARAGGEVRIPEHEIDVDTTHVLGTDFDPKTSELVLRAGSRHAQLIRVDPEAAQWTKPMDERMLELVQRGVVETDRHHVPTDDELVAAERKNAMRRSVRPQGPVT